MQVSQVMTPNVQFCCPEQSLDRAAQLMWESDCGSLPVCADETSARVVGMITDRDICMAALFHNCSLPDLRVGEVIQSQQLCVCEADDSLADVRDAMSTAKVRRLPVVDSTGRLVGIVSLADLSREAGRQQPLPDKEITDAEVNDTLAAICEVPQHRMRPEASSNSSAAQRI